MRCLTSIAFLFLMSIAVTSRAAETPDDKSIKKVLTTLVNAIKYGKDETAAKQLAFKSMAKRLLGETWDTMQAGDQKEAAADLEILIRKMSFGKGHEMFQYLDAVLFDPVKLQGEEAHCKATVVVHRDLKKQEIPIEWVLLKEGGQWKVVDTITVGESTTQGIREEQVQPLLKEGGVPKIMDTLRTKVKEAQKS